MNETITAGDTLDFTTSVSDYPASDGWSLVYKLIPRTTGTAITLTSVADGDAHRLQVASSTTAAWAPVVYSWVAYATKAAERYTLNQGVVTVLPDPGSATSYEARSGARQALDAVEAYLRDPNNITASQYQIAGRQLSRFGLPDLWRHRDRLRIEVSREEAAERIAAGLPSRSRVMVRFGP